MERKLELGEVLDMLGETTVVTLATVAGDRPAARAMTLRQVEGRLYMLTFPASPKVTQLRANPNCLVYMELHEGENSGFMRLDCTAMESSDGGERASLFETTRYARSYWASSDDPGFCLLRLTPVGGEVMKPGDMHTSVIDCGT